MIKNSISHIFNSNRHKISFLRFEKTVINIWFMPFIHLKILTLPYLKKEMKKKRNKRYSWVKISNFLPNTLTFSRPLKVNWSNVDKSLRRKFLLPGCNYSRERKQQKITAAKQVIVGLQRRLLLFI